MAEDIPMPLPVTAKKSNSRLIELYEAKAEHLVPKILRGFGISLTTQRLDYWRPLHNESDGAETLVICTEDTDTRPWYAAIREVLSLFHSNDSREIVAKIQVEIQNRRRMYLDYSQVLPNDPILLDALRQVEDKCLRNGIDTYGRGMDLYCLSYPQRSS